MYRWKEVNINVVSCKQYRKQNGLRVVQGVSPPPQPAALGGGGGGGGAQMLASSCRLRRII